ncbi:hypothetical protein NCCP28_01870 [Niallia sp. NCCP-28]|nr:hypothetical protein NCCP28_01870 [Niallia sp. NCCP-28]
MSIVSFEANSALLSLKLKKFNSLLLYQNLMNFDDRAIQKNLTISRLAFAGEKGSLVYGESFGSVTWIT